MTEKQRTLWMTPEDEKELLATQCLKGTDLPRRDRQVGSLPGIRSISYDHRTKFGYRRGKSMIAIDWGTTSLRLIS